LIRIYINDIKPKLEENDVFNCFVYTDKIEENRNVVENVTDKVTDKVTDNQNMIIQLILENNKVSTSEMAEKIGISKRKVLENIKKLKEKNIIQRIGNPKAGSWKINNP
jgi:predicted HTH transcriptional regulator